MKHLKRKDVLPLIFCLLMLRGFDRGLHRRQPRARPNGRTSYSVKYYRIFPFKSS